MTNIFKNYRELESDRFVYMSPKQELKGAGTEAVTPTLEATDKPKKPSTGEISKKIDKQEKKIQDQIVELKGKKADGSKWDKATDMFADKMNAHTALMFNEIRTEWGNEIAGTRTEKVRSSYHQKIDNLVGEIKTRLASASTHVSHKLKMDKIQEEYKGKVKETVVADFLNRKLDNHDKTPNTPRIITLSKYIVANTSININLGDLDVTDEESMDEYFAHVESYDSNLESQITDKVIQNALKQMIDEMPPNKATETETAYFKDYLLNTVEGHPIVNDHVAKALAIRFHFEFENDGETIKHFIDTNDNKVYTPDNFHEALDRIITHNKLNDFQEGKKYAEYWEERAEDRKDAQEKVMDMNLTELGNNKESQWVLDSIADVKYNKQILNPTLATEPGAQETTVAGNESDIKKPNENKEFTKQETEQLTQIVKQFGDKIEDANEDEVVLLTELEVTVNGKKDYIGDIIGASFASNISRYYQVKNGTKEGTISIAKNGSEDFKEVDAKGLADYIPEEDRGNYKKIVNGELTGEDLNKATKSIKENSKTYQNVLASAKEGNIEGVMDALTNGDPDVIKGFGIMDLIALFKMISEALQSDPPDFSVMADIANDFQNGNSPLKTMKVAKEKFEKELDKITDANSLLDLCNDPHGTTANGLFGKKTRYRSSLRSMARVKLAEKLNITVAENGFEQIKGGSVTKITTTASGVIEIGKTASGLVLTRYQIETKDDKETKVYTEPFKEGEMLSVADNTFAGLNAALKNDKTYVPPKSETDVADKGTDETAPETEEKKNAKNAEVTEIKTETA